MFRTSNAQMKLKKIWSKDETKPKEKKLLYKKNTCSKMVIPCDCDVTYNAHTSVAIISYNLFDATHRIEHQL